MVKINESTIIEELISIKSNAKSLLGVNINFIREDNNSKIAYLQHAGQVDEVIKEFNWIVPNINSLLKEMSIDLVIEQIKEINQTWDMLAVNRTFKITDNTLTKIYLLCNRLLAILKNQALTSSENKNRFQALKSEINLLRSISSPEVMKNLDQALEDFELNRILGTTLICGRIAVYLLDSIPGNINEKIAKINSKGLLTNKGSEEMLIKANQKMRGLFAHDLNIIPTPSEALAIFGDTINIIKVINDYNSKQKNNSSPHTQ